MKGIRCASILVVTLLAACARAPQPPERVVHEERALAKANAAWAGVYSKTAEDAYSPANVRRFSPYSATLEQGTWRVRTAAPADRHGRAPEADILAEDGTTTVRGAER